LENVVVLGKFPHESRLKSLGMMESGIVVKVRRDFLGNQVVNLKSSVVSQTDTFHSTEMHGKFDKVG
jgi:hypothetical protein